MLGIIRCIVSLVGLGLLMGCASSARTLKLSEVDLSDMHALQEIRSQLDARDGAALASYAVNHSIVSTSYCGQPLLRSDGIPPETVGEAIDLTLARDAEVRRTAQELRAAEDITRPQSAHQLAQLEWDSLISEKDALIDAQARLRMEYGAGVERRAEWKSTKKEMANLDKRLVLVKAKMPGPGE